MTADAISRRHAHLALAAVLFALVAMSAVLYRFPLGQYGFYPVCPIHLYTGWLCPGCGMTRAFAALIRGNLRDALHWNPLIAILVHRDGCPGDLHRGTQSVLRESLSSPTAFPQGLKPT
jgi:hypothetical protein